MTTRDYTANVISATKVVPDGNFADSKASGIWDINEVLDLIKGGNWPNVANISPSAFVNALFSTHLYTGTQQVQNITNGLDLSSKGGLVWLKTRSGTTAFGAHMLYDNERGAQRVLRSHETGADSAANNTLTSFNTNGFSLGVSTDGNKSGDPHVSWSFRKQPKFFDVVTYSGTGNAQAIAHSLSSTVGMIAVKRTDASSNWAVYHRGANGGTDPEDYHAGFNLSDEFANNAGYWNDTAPTTTHFTVGDDNNVNANNGTFVAYLFAHNNNDGGFGTTGDQDIIKCGYYDGTGSAGNQVDLGFEPQWLLTKSATTSQQWDIADIMRGMTADGHTTKIRTNNNAAEGVSNDKTSPNATGFALNDGDDEWNANGEKYIYVAIRRGEMQTPTAGTDVFAIDEGDSSGAPEYTSGFPVDMAIKRNVSDTDNWRISARLIQGINHYTNLQNADDADDKFKFDFQDGYYNDSQGANNFAWMWKRAKGYFDVVCYTGGSGADTITHNLGVAPEMIWVKNRGAQSNAARGNWVVYHSSVNTGYLNLHATAALATSDAASKFGNGSSLVAPTSSAFTVADDYDIGRNSNKYIAYLFATAAGVSKVGSFSPTGSTLNVDCGFSNSARFVLVKRTDSTGEWYLWDSVRGIVSGNDPYLYLNSTGSQTTNADYIDPHSSGFTITDQFFGSGNFIFYAIA